MTPPSKLFTPAKGTHVVRHGSHYDRQDLQAGVDLIPLHDAESALKRRTCPLDPNVSLLDYLCDPLPDVAPHRAASSVLEFLAARTEENAFDSVLVLRYIQAHALWKDPSRSDIRSADDLLASLSRPDLVRVTLHLGLATLALKRMRIKLIDGRWGPRWFERIPADIRHEGWTIAEDCSVQLLNEVAANATGGIGLDDAVARWSSPMADRSDLSRPRQLKVGGPRRASTVGHRSGGRKRRAIPTAGRIIAMEEGKEDTSQPTVGWGGASKRARRQSPRLRRTDAHSDDGEGEPAGAICTAARAVSETLTQPDVHTSPRTPPEHLPPAWLQASPPRSSEADQYPTPQPHSVAIPSTEPSSRAPSPFPPLVDGHGRDAAHTRTITLPHGGTSRVSSACREPDLAHTLRKVVKICHELKDASGISGQCCDDCRSPACDISRVVVDVLARPLNALQQVERHRLGGEGSKPFFPTPSRSRGPPLVGCGYDDD